MNKLGKNLTGRGGQYICDMLDEEKEGSAAQHKIKKKKNMRDGLGKVVWQKIMKVPHRNEEICIWKDD